MSLITLTLFLSAPFTLISLQVTSIPSVYGTPDPTNNTYIDPSNVTDLTLTSQLLTISPTSDGTFTDWSGTYTDWDDYPTHDGDTTSVSTPSAGMRESSELEDHTDESWDIARVTVVIVARDAPQSQVKPMLVIGGTPHLGVTHNLTTVYLTYTSEWGKNPDTGQNWTWTEIGALEAGVHSVVASDISVTQLYVEISGPRFTVAIAVDDVQDLWSFQFEIGFNPDVVQGVYPDEAAGEPFVLGPFLGSAGGTPILVSGAGWDNTLGRLSIALAYLLQSDPVYCPDGGGVLATVTFDVVGQGESEIRLGENTGLKDYTGTFIVKGRNYVQDGYFRNIETNLMPNARFTVTPVDTPLAHGPLEGYNTRFDGTLSTAAAGRTIQTYKWYFWETVRKSMYRFPTSLLNPNGDGTYTDWTGTYSDWVADDGDFSYIKAAAGDLSESSTLTGHTTETWPIARIRVAIRAKTNVVTDEKVRLMIVVGGTPYFGAEQTLTVMYSTYVSEWSINPATDSAWTWSAIDALQAGVASEQVGTTWTGEIRVTQLYVEVVPAPFVSSTDSVSWDTVTWNYTSRGLWNVTLTVIDEQGAVGTLRSYVEIKAHDVHVIAITTNTTQTEYPRGLNYTEIGDVMEIDVTVENQGHFPETFNVTCFWSAIYAVKTRNGIIGTQYGITLAAGADTTLIFYWDTEGYNLSHPTYYTLHANASRVPYEYDIEWTSKKVAPNEAQASVRIRFHDIAVTDIALSNYLLLKPDGDGTFTDWSGTYADWDDYPTHDEDSTTVYATDKSLHESSTLTDRTAEAWTIEKVRVTVVARSNISTTSDRFYVMLVIGGTKYDSMLTQYTPTTTYSKYTGVWTNNPATASAWTWSDIDALEAGVRSYRSFGSWQIKLMVTQLYVEVFASLTAPVVEGETVQVAVTVVNEGDFNETSISVAAYYDENPIGTPQTIELLINKTFSDEEYVGIDYYMATLDFNWDTTGVTSDTYRISANASTVPDEYDTADNTLVNGIARWPGMPEASFTYSPTEPIVDQSVTFNASASNDLEGAIASYEWDFGDGETDSGEVVHHPYTEDGAYTVTLTVSDGANTDAEEKTIMISPAPNIAVISVTAAPSEDVDVGDYVTIQVIVSNEGGLEETLDVDVYYDSAPVGSRSGVTLTVGATKTVTFIWNTIGVYPSTYTINATVPPVPNEETTEDNTASFSPVSFYVPPDETPPSIGTPSRAPAGDVLVDVEVTVSVSVTDAESGVKNVTLSYTTDNGTSWDDLPMAYNAISGFYEGTIPGQSYCTWVKYRIVAYDNAENVAVESNVGEYYVYHVIPEFPSLIILPLLMVLTVVAAVSGVLLRRRSRVR